jgi:hypothetical protein
MRFIAVLAASLTIGGAAGGLQTAPGTTEHNCPMMQRADETMGFAETKTTHHFRLRQNGGAIEVEANDPNDTVSRDQIRMHLSHIAGMFAEGNFDAPMFIHDTTPPGVPTMIKLRGEIHYQYEETPAGGRLLISTRSAHALDAVHAFLLFQIVEHRTGDEGSIERSGSK